jgi:hypothetical protein
MTTHGTANASTRRSNSGPPRGTWRTLAVAISGYPLRGIDSSGLTCDLFEHIAGKPVVLLFNERSYEFEQP